MGVGCSLCYPVQFCLPVMKLQRLTSSRKHRVLHSDADLFKVPLASHLPLGLDRLLQLLFFLVVSCCCRGWLVSLAEAPVLLKCRESDFIGTPCPCCLLTMPGLLIVSIAPIDRLLLLLLSIDRFGGLYVRTSSTEFYVGFGAHLRSRSVTGTG